MRVFLEQESPKYKGLEVLVASEGQSRIDLYNEGKVVDTIHIYRWDIEEVLKLMKDLGLEREESQNWDRKKAESKLENAFASGGMGKDEL